MTKKEFKKKCKAEKTLSYKLSFSGFIVAVVALVIVVATLLFAKAFLVQIAGYIIGAGTAIIGIGLDLAGEIQLSKAYKDYCEKETDRT